MARSLPSQRRVAREILENFTDEPLSPIISESEPEEDSLSVHSADSLEEHQEYDSLDETNNHTTDKLAKDLVCLNADTEIATYRKSDSLDSNTEESASVSKLNNSIQNCDDIQSEQVDTIEPQTQDILTQSNIAEEHLDIADHTKIQTLHNTKVDQISPKAQVKALKLETEIQVQFMLPEQEEFIDKVIEPEAVYQNETYSDTVPEDCDALEESDSEVRYSLLRSREPSVDIYDESDSDIDEAINSKEQFHASELKSDLHAETVDPIAFDFENSSCKPEVSDIGNTLDSVDISNQVPEVQVKVAKTFEKERSLEEVLEFVDDAFSLNECQLKSVTESSNKDIVKELDKTKEVKGKVLISKPVAKKSKVESQKKLQQKVKVKPSSKVNKPLAKTSKVSSSSKQDNKEAIANLESTKSSLPVKQDNKNPVKGEKSNKESIIIKQSISDSKANFHPVKESETKLSTNMPGKPVSENGDVNATETLDPVDSGVKENNNDDPVLKNADVKKDNYCDSLEGDSMEERLTDIQPPENLFEDEIAAEAEKLASSIVEKARDDSSDELKEFEEVEKAIAETHDSLDEADSLEDLKNSKENKASENKSEQSEDNATKNLPDSKPQSKVTKLKKPGFTNKKKDGPPSPKLSPKSEKSKPKIKIPKFDKQKSKPPIPPIGCKKSPALVRQNKLDENGKQASVTSPTLEPQISPINSTTQLDMNGTKSESTSENNSTTDDVFKSDKDFDDVLNSKVGEGLAQTISQLRTKDDTAIISGLEHARLPLTRSSSGDSLASLGAESTMTTASTMTSAKRIHENKASVKRRQAILAKRNIPLDEETDEYLTPSQRKDKMLRDLKKELKNIQVALACKEVEMHDLLLAKEGELWDRLKAKDDENSKLRQELVEIKDIATEMEAKLTDLHEKYETKVQEIKEIKADLERREAAHQEMYLKMYEKGQQSAAFERQDQLANLAEESPESVSPQELLKKLQDTQMELLRWQALKRQEAYDEAVKPESTSDAKLNFLKDSMFHYLTDKEDEGLHLRAMVSMLGFTDVQIRKIKAASEKNKGRKASAK